MNYAILLLSITVLLLVVQLTKPSENFGYSAKNAQSLCANQASYIAKSPFISGPRSQKQAYENCVRDFAQSQGKNMPSAYLTSVGFGL